MLRSVIGLLARPPAYGAGLVFALPHRRRLAPREPLAEEDFEASPSRIPIGFWHDEPSDELWPHPQALVDWGWEPRRRWKIVRYLHAGLVADDYRGWSYCRIGCWRKHLGTADLTDGVWVWPEGLAHYVAFHGVRLPDEFVAYAAANDFRIPDEPRSGPLPARRETFWEDWSREHARFAYEPNCWACAEERGESGAAFFSRWRMLGRRVVRWADRWKRPGEP
jgi:hypothetical protein